jgi:hypothetical protein
MSRSFFLDQARRGLRAPLATDLFLHDGPEPEAVRRDGARLGQVIESAARRFGSPLALPLMDLTLDKADLLARLGQSAHDAERFQFAAPFDDRTRASLARDEAPLGPGSVARDGALRSIARETDLFPIGLVIGPFSLATKLLADPITPAAMAASGVEPGEDPSVRLLFDCLEAAEGVVIAAARRQIEAGARALIVCEPTASIAYLSPRQIRAGSDIFERLVLAPNLRLKGVLDAADVDLIFHDCGELIPEMVSAFGHRIHPAVLSLGSSRALWEDAALVPKDVVLYGNLPSKSFYSDATMPVAEVRRRTDELVAAMSACGHPHILGSECDVLHVPDAAATIRRKVDAMIAPEVAS